MFHEATFVHESVSGSRLCGTSSTTARYIPGMTGTRMFNVITLDVGSMAARAAC